MVSLLPSLSGDAATTVIRMLIVLETDSAYVVTAVNIAIDNIIPTGIILFMVFLIVLRLYHLTINIMKEKIISPMTRAKSVVGSECFILPMKPILRFRLFPQ